MLNEQHDVKAKFAFSGKLKEAADPVNADQKYVAGNFGIEKPFTNGVMIEGGISKSDLNRVIRRKERDVNSETSVTKYHNEAAMRLPYQMRLSYQFKYAENDHRNRGRTGLSHSKSRISKLSLGYSINGGEFTPEQDKIRFGLDVTHARTKLN